MAKDVTHLRQELLDLSASQAELRRRLAAYRAATGETVGAVAGKTVISWVSLRRFVDGTLALSGGKGLTGLCELLSCQELGEKITALAKQVGDRHLGLANQPAEIIETALDVVEYYGRAKGYTMAEFAAAFDDDAPLILGILNGSQEAFGELDEEATRLRITQVLIEDEERARKMAAAKERLASERRQAGEQLAQIVNPLIARVGTKESLAGMLNCHRTTLNKAMAGEASLEEIQRLIREATRLAALMVAPASAADSRVTAAEPQTKEAASAASGLPDELSALGGETTAAGIKHVLTAASFRLIETVALVDLRDLLISQIEAVRLLLNYGSQLGDDTAREILREDKKVSAELRELITAIRLFTFEDPSRLLDLYDNERALREGEVGPSRTKGSRRERPLWPGRQRYPRMMSGLTRSTGLTRFRPGDCCRVSSKC